MYSYLPSSIQTTTTPTCHTNSTHCIIPHSNPRSALEVEHIHTFCTDTHALGTIMPGWLLISSRIRLLPLALPVLVPSLPPPDHACNPDVVLLETSKYRIIAQRFQTTYLTGHPQIRTEAQENGASKSLAGTPLVSRHTSRNRASARPYWTPMSHVPNSAVSKSPAKVTLHQPARSKSLLHPHRGSRICTVQYLPTLPNHTYPTDIHRPQANLAPSGPGTSAEHQLQSRPVTTHTIVVCAMGYPADLFAFYQHPCFLKSNGDEVLPVHQLYQEYLYGTLRNDWAMYRAKTKKSMTPTLSSGPCLLPPCI